MARSHVILPVVRLQKYFEAISSFESNNSYTVNCSITCVFYFKQAVPWQYLKS